MTEHACRWAGNDHQPRILRTHLADCETPGCAGCQPCPEQHCRCGWHLYGDDQRCPRCVGRTRTRLGRIADLCLLLSAAAAERGVTSAAAVLAGPVPSVSTANARDAWAHGRHGHTGGLCRCPVVCTDALPMPAGPTCKRADPDHDRPCSHYACQRRNYRPTCPGLVDWLSYADDQRHPLAVLGGWDLAVTEHLGHGHRTMRITVGRAAAYLQANLTDLARDPDFPFDELDRDVERCVDHVENVLAVAPRLERGVPCPTCHDAGRPAQPLVREYADDQPDDAHDQWVCPRADCGDTWTVQAYRDRVGAEHLQHATELTASQIAHQYRVSESTIRRWASGWVDGSGVRHEPVVKKRGYDGQRRQLYAVADVLAMRDTSDAA